MPHSLPAIIAHVRTQNRPASYGGMLLAEIDRLTAAVADLTDARDHLMAMRAVDAGEMVTLTDAELEAYLKENPDV